LSCWCPTTPSSIADLNQDRAHDDEQETGSDDPSVVGTGVRQCRRLLWLNVDFRLDSDTFILGQWSQVNDPAARVDDDLGVHGFGRFLTIGWVGRQRRVGL
jgi:hypothetical protein